jgi:hypothetical protein
MSLFEQFCAYQIQRFIVDLYGMVSAHETQVRGHHGMFAGQTITLRGYVNQGVYHYGPAGNALPDGCRRFYQFLLENLIFCIPHYFQRHFLAQRDTLRATDTGVVIVDGIPLVVKPSRSRWADFDAFAAACAFFPLHVWARIRMHALLLRTGGKAHGYVLDGSAENCGHMPFKMRKYYETVCFLHDGSDLNRFKMFETGRYINNASAFGTIRYDDRATEELFRVTMFLGCS